jgi:hypothetical protein
LARRRRSTLTGDPSDLDLQPPHHTTSPLFNPNVHSSVITGSTSGIVHPHCTDSLICVVACEHWPQWLLACGPLHLQCRAVYIFAPLPAWLPSLQQVFPSVQFYCQATASDLPIASQVVLWCLSGSSPWLHNLLPHLPASLQAIAEGRLSDIELPAAWSSLAIDPTSLGSVMSGTCHILSQNVLVTRPPSNDYHRTLRHILDPVERAPLCKLITSSRTPVLSPSSWLPSAEPLCPVRCKSVFVE